MFNLGYLGIYENTIQSAVDTAESALDRVNARVSDRNALHSDAESIMKECGDFGDITNSIINAYFDAAKNIIERYSKKYEVDYYVNGDDSHFYIDGEEIF